MDPDFNKRDSFHPTIEHPRMTAEEWTEAYKNAWKQFYGKQNLIRILSRWNHNPHMYWAMMSNLIWYKNAALIEKQHPMVAGFLRLKDRRNRRPGFAIDSLPVHLWKRSREVFSLFVSWAKLLKEMEDVWLQTRKKSEREERWLEEIQKIQGEIWQTLRIAEWRKTYNNAKESLPAKAKALLDPFEELSTKILFSRKDLNRFLKQWGSLQDRLQELRRGLAAEGGEAVQKWLDELCKHQESIRVGGRIREWQDRYTRLRQGLPSIYSRQDLQKFWGNTVQNLRKLKLWQIRPIALVTALYKDFLLTTSFALNFSRGTNRTQQRPLA